MESEGSLWKERDKRQVEWEGIYCDLHMKSSGLEKWLLRKAAVFTRQRTNDALSSGFRETELVSALVLSPLIHHE